MITNNKGAAGPAVAFRDVVKVYHPDIKALDHVCFDIQPGETVALLGPNGAGKSTAIDTMLGLRSPTSGEVRVLGGPASAAVAAGRIGGMLQTGGLPEGANLAELIGLFRQLYHDRRSAGELLALAGIGDLADRRGRRGQRERPGQRGRCGQRGRGQRERRGVRPGRACRAGRPPGRDAVRGRGRARRVLAASERAADRLAARRRRRGT